MTANLMDNQGTINITITTEADFTHTAGSKIFRPDTDVISDVLYKGNKVTKKISSFF